MDINTLASISSIFIGISLILWGFSILYVMLTMSPFIAGMASVPVVGTSVYSILSPYITFGWMLGISTFIAGFLSIITGIVYLVHRE